jgi:hypothetical protein
MASSGSSPFHWGLGLQVTVTFTSFFFTMRLDVRAKRSLDGCETRAMEANRGGAASRENLRQPYFA